MHIRKLLAPALLLGAVVALPAGAQTVLPLSIEARGGVSLPRGEFNDGAGTGFNVGAAVHYRVAPMVGVYAGYEFASFAADSAGDLEGVDQRFKDTGFRLGARFEIPLGAMMTGVQPWLEGGATFNQSTIKLSDGSASLSVSSDRSVGYEVGAGLSFAVAPKISITPGVRYRAHTADFSDEEDVEGPAKIDVSYFSIDLGVNIHL